MNGGKIVTYYIAGKSKKSITPALKIDIDKGQEYMQMFTEIWRTLKEFYYDPQLHGVQWNNIRQTYQEQVQSTRIPSEFYLLIKEMLGELNSSHLNIYPPAEKDRPVTAAMGIDMEKVEEGVRITGIVPLGPFYWYCPDAVGWIITEIDGESLAGNTNIYQYLENKAGKRLHLKLKKGQVSRPLFIKPLVYRREKSLRYDAWEKRAEERVNQWSRGKIGYIHMKDMGRKELLRFYRNFEKAAVDKKGIILDLRYNTGGNVHDQVLNTLLKKRYTQWKIRDSRMTYQPTFAHRPKPIVLLINEFSLSDAEMTAAGFKTLGLGSVIGTPTYGWLIFTSRRRLLDGSNFRIPFWGCYTLDGRDLETSGGVAPDIRIDQTFPQRIRNEDLQLKRAVEELLNSID